MSDQTTAVVTAVQVSDAPVQSVAGVTPVTSSCWRPAPISTRLA